MGAAAGINVKYVSWLQFVQKHC